MRKFMWLAAVTLGLAWAESAQAQQVNGPIFNFPSSINIMPNFTNNSPMDYRNPNAPIGGTMYRSASYKLSSLFFSPGRNNTFTSKTTFGNTVLPTPAQMQAAAPSYFQAFQMYRAQPIHP